MRAPGIGAAGVDAAESSFPSSLTLAVARPSAPFPGVRSAFSLLSMFCWYCGSSLATSTSWSKITQAIPPAAAIVNIMTNATAGARPTRIFWSTATAGLKIRARVIANARGTKISRAA